MVGRLAALQPGCWLYHCNGTPNTNGSVRVCLYFLRQSGSVEVEALGWLMEILALRRKERSLIFGGKWLLSVYQYIGVGYRLWLRFFRHERNRPFELRAGTNVTVSSCRWRFSLGNCLYVLQVLLQKHHQLLSVRQSINFNRMLENTNSTKDTIPAFYS